MLSSTTGPGAPFHAGNPVWDRFVQVVTEHFETTVWLDEAGQPTLVSLGEQAGGGALTLAPVDPLAEATAVVLVLAGDGQLCVHGPLAGLGPANRYAARLSLNQAVDTCPALLHLPTGGPLPAEAWASTPVEVCENLWLSPPDGHTGPTALVLIDRWRPGVAVVGPFPNHAEAHGWRPASEDGDLPDRHVVALTAA